MATTKRREVTLAEANKVVDACSKLSCSHLIRLQDDHIPAMLTLYHSKLLDIDALLNAQ